MHLAHAAAACIELHSFTTTQRAGLDPDLGHRPLHASSMMLLARRPPIELPHVFKLSCKELPTPWFEETFRI